MKLKDKLTFGKYIGKTVEQVLEKDAQYLQWAKEKGIAHFDDDLLEAISETAKTQHAEWLREYCEDEQQVEY